MATDYIPSSYKNLNDWLQKQLDQLPAAADTLGISADEQAEYLASVNALHGAVSKVVNLQDQLDSLTADLEALKTTHLPVLRQGVKRAKTHAGFTPGLGQQLSWVRTGNGNDPDSSQPVINLTAQPGKVRADGRKPGFEAVNLYFRRQGETNWRLVAIRKRKFPIYDETPLAVAGTPEVREYRAIGVVDDEEAGQPSVSVEIVFAG